jgi:hypothetical protein
MFTDCFLPTSKATDQFQHAMVVNASIASPFAAQDTRSRIEEIYEIANGTLQTVGNAANLSESLSRLMTSIKVRGHFIRRVTVLAKSSTERR